MNTIETIIVVVILAVVAAFAAGNDYGVSKTKVDIYENLSANVQRTARDEEVVQVTTTIKFKDGVPVEIAPFKEIK